MTISKDQLFEKIDNLLIDINSKYLELKSVDKVDPIELTLLSGSIDYLSYHIKALKYVKDGQETPEETMDLPRLVRQETETIVFTPESQIEEESADHQDVVEEIPSSAIPNVFQTEEHRHSKREGVDQAVEEIEVQDMASNRQTEKETVEDLQSEPANSNLIVEDQRQVFVPHITESVENIVEEPTLEEVVSTIEQEVVSEKEEEARKPMSINELIQQQKMAGKNLTQQFNTSTRQTERVLDIKTAISLNDKLLFIRDLFNGYSLAYSEAIELLNRFDNFEEADAFLQSNYALKNGWSEKPQTVEKLYVVLRKRFG